MIQSMAKMNFMFYFLVLQMLLHLFSDANYNLLGFNATYTFSLCPGACGGHGRCESSTLKCHCHPGWGGASCTTPLCSKTCSVNGQCDRVWGQVHSHLRVCTCHETQIACLKLLFLFSQKGERCLCKPGFMGQSCQLDLHDNSGAGQWSHVSEGNPYTPPRTGSAGVYLSSTGSMYLFGGESDLLLISTDLWSLSLQHNHLSECLF